MIEHRREDLQQAVLLLLEGMLDGGYAGAWRRSRQGSAAATRVAANRLDPELVSAWPKVRRFALRSEHVPWRAEIVAAWLESEGSGDPTAEESLARRVREELDVPGHSARDVLWLARLLWRSRREALSLELARKLSTAAPKSYYAQLLYGERLMARGARGDFTLAQYHLAIAHGIAPQRVSPKVDLLWALPQAGLVDSAIDLAPRWVTEHPENALLHANAAIAPLFRAAEGGQGAGAAYETALGYLTRAVELGADTSAVHYNRSLALAGAGHKAEAAAAARRCIELSPSNANAYEHLLAQCMNLWDFEQAHDVLNRWADRCPDIHATLFDRAARYLNRVGALEFELAFRLSRPELHASHGDSQRVERLRDRVPLILGDSHAAQPD